MDVPVGAQEYIDQGKTLLLQGQAREAAVAFAHAVKADPNLVGGHLGLAQANLALGSYGLVHMACRRVQELQTSGPDADLARALLFVLDRRYDRAAESLEKVTVEDPNRAYAQALRAYCLRQLGKDYEAALAEAKAARIAGNVDFSALFPKVSPPQRLEPGATPGAPSGTLSETSAADPRWQEPSPDQRWRPEPQQPPWQPPSQVRRQVARVRFATRGSGLFTYSLIIINVLVYLIGAVLAHNILYPAPADLNTNVLYSQGVQYNFAVLQEHQYWRLVTAMFLHINWEHIGLNMLSLYFIGLPVERLYGAWRFLLIYFGAGIFGGILTLALAGSPFIAVLGASGAIFGVFGALGVFLWQNRRALGSGMLTQWAFWLVLNLVFTFGFSNIAVSGHIGGLSMGLLLGLLLMPGFWTPVRVRLNRGQTGNALLWVFRPVAAIIAIGAALIILTLFFGGGR